MNKILERARKVAFEKIKDDKVKYFLLLSKNPFNTFKSYEVRNVRIEGKSL